MRQVPWLLAALWPLSNACVKTAAPLKPNATVAITVQPPVKTDVAYSDEWGLEERRKLSDAVAQAEAILGSPAFQRRLAALDDLHSSPKGPSVAGRTLLLELLQQRVPVLYTRGAKHSQTASTAVGKAGRTCTTLLGPENLDRWVSGEDVPSQARRACLINTLVHEWTHTILDDAGIIRYTDDKHQFSDRPLVSYGVGALAHCVYLEASGAISSAFVWACVETVGTNMFAAVCETPAWLEKQK